MGSQWQSIIPKPLPASLWLLLTGIGTWVAMGRKRE
ncbi:MAG: VPLPA-CTERM sorting domain-containing protein [Candidatus Competibacterales bacterium]